jgi:phosphatidylglycerol:prolipoprotein diacylglycerol transferase
MLLNWNPIAFQLGPLAVRWYGIFMTITFIFGSLYLLRKGRSLGLSEDFLLNLSILIIVSGIIGARLMFVLANYPQWFIHDPVQILKIYEGGLAWHGGLIGGGLVSWWYIRRNQVNFNLIADLAVPGMAFGYALVRIANIANQEVLGRMSPFAFGRWPAQPVGSLIGVILLFRFFYVERKNPPAGYQFWSFIFYHQLLRGLVEETIRENGLSPWGWLVPRLGFGFLTWAQLATPLIMGIAFYFMWRSRRAVSVVEN